MPRLPAKTLPGKRGHLLAAWRIPLAVTISAVLIQVLRLGPTLRYQRAAITHGEWWRLLTGNLVHLGWMHLGRDLAGLILIWFCFFPHLSERLWLAVIFICMLGVSGGLYIFSPEILWYVGLSGILYGLFATGAVLEWRHRPRLSALLLGLMWAVVIYGLLVGPLPGEDIGLGGPIVPQAHLYGAICGMGFGVLRNIGLALRDPTRVGGQ